jgi:type III restriction enzyme
VSAWAKNDHLGFEVPYVYRGVVRKYRPDFLVRLANGDMLILETKGQDTELDRVKRCYLEEWVQAVNTHGAFGRWQWKVARHPGEIRDILLQSLEQ